jgi:peptidoglycan hydrolase-like protein with peptidoglycan-binding domain
MNKGWKWTLISLGVIGAGVGLYFVVKPLFGKNKWEDFEDDEDDVISTPSIYIDDSFPLKKDSGGKRVEALQKYLEAQGATLVGGVDGKFGPSTEEAVETYVDSSGAVTKTYYDTNIKSYE